MSNLNNRARQIFLENAGDPKLMKENNELKEYEHFKISKDIEISWKDEYINEQFINTDVQSTDVMQLVSIICGMIVSFNHCSDYKKLLSIKNKYLTKSDIFEQIMYFNKVIESISNILILNNNITNKDKLEIVCELEAILINTINNKDDIPDKLYGEITQKYGLEPKVDFPNGNLSRVYNEVKRIKMILI